MSILRQSFTRFLVLLLLGAAFGWFGPYGTYLILPLPQRVAFWSLGILLIGFPAHPAMEAIVDLPRIAAWPIPLQAAFGSLIIGFPATFIVIALQTIFIRAPEISIASLAEIYISVTLVTAFISIPWRILNAQLRRNRDERAAPVEVLPASAPNTAAVEAAPSPFLHRIPPKLGTELLCVATEDHYLRVVTALGSDLILFRLSDALAELKPLAGQQVHRSYWVAERAVAAVEQNGNRTFLVLTNGSKVPVSQTFLPAIRRAGWLEKKTEASPAPLIAETAKS